MSKNWLIRTKSNHILGPISKDKVLELLQNGSIKADDEVCCGNGFWFFIREDDMVARFLLGREQQMFNPISEAKDVLTFPPRGQDQEDDITRVGGFNMKDLGRESTPPNGTYLSSMPTGDDKPAVASESKKKSERVSTPTESVQLKVSKTKTPKAKLKKQNYLQYLLAACFILLLAVLWYRKSIFRYFRSAEISLIESVQAQEEAPAEKKK